MNKTISYSKARFLFPIFFFLLFSATTVTGAPQINEHETVVVTANRSALTTSEAISSVLVFTEEDIEKSQARSVADFLKGNAGVHFASNGGRGALTSMFIRGSNPNQVLVLIDGIKVGSATSGTVSFEDIPLSQIERIELVKGPRSSLYGSEAIGGIVQIFTKKGKSDTQLAASVSIGDEDTVLGNASVQGKWDALSYAFGFSGETTGGYDSCQAEAATAFGGCFADEPDNDGYETLAGNVQLSYQLGEMTEISVMAIESENETEFDGSFQDRSESRQRIFGLGLGSQLVDSWFVDFKAGQSQDNSDNFKGDAYSSTFDTTRDTVSLFNEFQISSNIDLLAGADFQRDEVTSSEAYVATERENYGYFTQLFYKRASHTVEISGRYDDNEQFGAEKTGALGYGYQVNDNLRAVASYGTAFRAPTFNELYYPGYGNANLKPEQSRSTELGLRWRDENTHWSVALFNTEVENLIGLDAAFLPANLSKAKLRGLDLSIVNQHSESFSSNFQYSYVRAVDASGGINDGKRLQRRPPATAKLTLDYEMGAWNHSTDFIVASGTYDNLANTNEIDPYRVMNLRTAYTFAEQWKLAASLENVFDSNYQTARFYDETPRRFLLTLSYRD